MNKTDLVKHVAKEADVTQAVAAKAVDAVFGGISASLAAGEKVQIPGFGSFEVRERAERVGHDPRTKEEVLIPKSRAVGFRIGKALRDKVNQ